MGCSVIEWLSLSLTSFLSSFCHNNILSRPASNVLTKLPIFLCCNSKSYLFCLLAVPVLLITAHTLAQSSVSYLINHVSRLAIRKYARFPHRDRMGPFVFL